MNYCPGCGISLTSSGELAAKEKLTSLVVRLEKHAIKAIEGRPNGAPIVTQVVKALTKVKKKLKSKMSLTGAEAVVEFMKAVDGEFLSDMAPIGGLVKKYDGKLFRYDKYKSRLSSILKSRGD